jgi:K+-sensing histidine kinase KdpD
VVRWQQFSSVLAGTPVKAATTAYWLWSCGGILLLPLLGCVLLLPLRGAVSPTDVAMLMLLWISAMALQFGKTPALLTTLWSVLLLNWCFVPPYYTLDVHDTNNFISFFVMAAFGLFISYLADRLRRQQEHSARQQLQVELEQQRAVLLRSLSHDLRTPLATIMGASSMLADDNLQLSDEQRRQQAQNIYQQSLLLNQHFEKVLELSKAQLLRDSLRRSSFSAADLMAGALARRPEDAASLAPICQQGPEAAGQLFSGDAELLEMALANMLENALRHGAPPYQLQLSAAGGWYQLRLRNAPGRKITVQRDSGTGLGLRICQTVAALHQGRFVLESNDSGVTALLEWPQ